MSSLSPIGRIADEPTLACPPDPQCTTPSIRSGNVAYGEVQRPFSFRIDTGGDFVAISVSALPDWASFDHTTQVIHGLPTTVGDTFHLVTASNPCGTATQILKISIASFFMVWGNYTPPIPPQFTQSDLLDAAHWDTLPGSYNIRQAITRHGTYEFAVPTEGPQWYQVMWIPDFMLGEPPDPLLSITVQGFTFNLQPANNTPYQSLMMFGMPGKVFVSAAANNGGFTISGGNPWIIA